jgi:CrcB protein
MTFKSLLLVGAGGAIGSITRFLIAHLLAKVSFMQFPFATFLINILGCFAIGYFAQFFPDTITHHNARIFLIVGLCGGFTTFSTFSMDNWLLIQNAQYLTFLAYALLSVLLGLGALILGLKCA